MQQPDPLHLSAWRAFLEAYAAVVHQLNDELERDQGFPLTWYDVLLHLAEAGGTMRMHELAESLLISRSATTRFVERLERRDFVERSMCSEDRRGTNVTLTETGRSALRVAAPGHLDGVERLFAAHLSDEEAVSLRETLTKIAEANRTTSGHS